MVTYPQDWTSAEITEYVDIYQGGTPKTSVAQYWGGSIIWVTPSEITQNGSMYIHNSVRKITEQGLHNSSACLLPIGTILLCTRATIGELSIAESAMTTNQGFKNLVCKSNADNVFFAYLLKTKKDEMIARAIGSTFLELSKKELSKFRVTVPDVTEQKLIAETLSYIDTHIANLTELIEKKKGIRDGALEDLVSGRTRLKGFDGEWDEYLFDVYFTLLSNNTLSRDKLSRYGSIGNIHYGDVLIKYHSLVTDKDEIPRIKTDIDTRSFKRLQSGDVVIADTAEDDTVGKAIQICGVTMPLVGGLHTIVCRPNYTTALGYLGYYINSKCYHNQLLPHITGIKVSSISKKAIKTTVLRLPKSIDEQKAIVEVLSSLDSEIASLEEEKDKMLQIKAGAMDDLLTGRVRLTRQGG